MEQVHWLNMDAKGRKMAAAAAKKSQKNEEALLGRLGIRAETSEDDVRELAARWGVHKDWFRNVDYSALPCGFGDLGRTT